jgi:MoaA/NifB/PqqE/SkfB family radical SAM enzyme
MGREVFDRILEAIAASDPRPTVVLGGIGEPLMHEGLMPFVERVRGLGAGVELITNGLLLDEDRVAQLRELELDRLWLSVDGGLAGGHGHTMAPQELADLVHAIWRSETVHNFPLGRKLRMGLVFVAMKGNLHELPKVLSLARHLHADRVLISNLLPYSREISEEVLYSRSVQNTRVDLRVTVPRIDLDAGLLERLAEAMSHRDLADLSGPAPSGPSSSCPFIRAGSVSIRWDGAVSPCLPLLHTHSTVPANVQRRSRECVFGSLRDQQLLDVWQLPEYVAFRERVAAFSFPSCAACGTCELAEHNEEDCVGNPFPTCGGCLWAQGLILCP